MAFIKCDFFSDSLGFASEINVVLPEKAKRLIGMNGKVTEGLPPVLYLLHGMSDDHTIWMRRTSIERYASEYGIAVVMPNCHRSLYRNVNQQLRYWDFLSQELPEAVHRFFKLSDKREDTFAAGLSMGGYGALKLALNCPEKFAAAGIMSAALGHLWLKARSESEFAFVVGSMENIKHTEDDLPYIAEKLAESGKPLPKIYQSCGTEDGFITVNAEYRDMLKKLGYDVTWYQGPGTHCWEFWDSEIRKILAWLPLKDR